MGTGPFFVNFQQTSETRHRTACLFAIDSLHETSPAALAGRYSSETSNIMNSELTKRIEAACASTMPRTKDRNKALAAIKWRLKAKTGFYACFDGLTSDASAATVFDGRDNEEVKARFFKALTGQTFTVELL